MSDIAAPASPTSVRLRWRAHALKHACRKVTNAVMRRLGYVYCERESNIMAHAREEFRVMGWDSSDDEMQASICECMLDLLGVMAAQGHSGFSASYLIANVTPLMKFEPISPLTGEDWEWNEVGDGWFQNRRCGRVFKGGDRFPGGQAYDGEAVIFRDPDGGCFTNRDSSRAITFPYTPKHEYVDRGAA